MPQPNQKTVTIPLWVWVEAKKYFEKNYEDLRMKNITNITGLITQSILRAIR